MKENENKKGLTPEEMDKVSGGRRHLLAYGGPRPKFPGMVCKYGGPGCFPRPKPKPVNPAAPSPKDDPTNPIKPAQEPIEDTKSLTPEDLGKISGGNMQLLAYGGPGCFPKKLDNPTNPIKPAQENPEDTKSLTPEDLGKIPGGNMQILAYGGPGCFPKPLNDLVKPIKPEEEGKK